MSRFLGPSVFTTLESFHREHFHCPAVNCSSSSVDVTQFVQHLEHKHKYTVISLIKNGVRYGISPANSKPSNHHCFDGSIHCLNRSDLLRHNQRIRKFGIECPLDLRTVYSAVFSSEREFKNWLEDRLQTSMTSLKLQQMINCGNFEKKISYCSRIKSGNDGSVGFCPVFLVESRSSVNSRIEVMYCFQHSHKRNASYLTLTDRQKEEIRRELSGFSCSHVVRKMLIKYRNQMENRMHYLTYDDVQTIQEEMSSVRELPQVRINVEEQIDNNELAPLLNEVKEEIIEEPELENCKKIIQKLAEKAAEMQKHGMTENLRHLSHQLSLIYDTTPVHQHQRKRKLDC